MHISTTQTTELLSLLHDLIGLQGHYHGHHYELVEIIDRGPKVVLERIDQQIIQNDSYGEAHRLVNSTYTVNVQSELGTQIHPVLQEFLGDAICQTLQQPLQQPV